MAKRIIWDCDTGHEDAIALSLALSSDQIDIIGITAVMGGMPVDNVAFNTLRVLAMMNKSIPVAKGAARPIARSLSFGGMGDTFGMDALPPAKANPSPMSALELQKMLLKDSVGKVTLLCTGPLTNIALLMLDAPGLVREKVEEIIALGGAVDGGNITHSAEYNFYTDPEAAKIVFAFGVPVTMCGLDACRSAYITKKQHKHILSKIDTPRGRLCARVVSAYLGGEESAYLCDALAPLLLIDPSLFKTAKAAIEVETSSDLCDGVTVCRVEGTYHAGDVPRPHTVVLDVDRARYFELLVSLLGGMSQEEGK